jgi:hypothetical protein
VALTPTLASNFVLGYFRSITHETRSSWEKMAADSRPSYAEFERSTAEYDEMVPDTNPEVAAKDGGYLVIGKVTLTGNGQKTVRDYQALVTLVDGQPKIALTD